MIGDNTGVDYESLESLPSKILVSHLNQFVLSQADGLAIFGAHCDQKLSALSSRLQRLEAALNLIEKKLGDVQKHSI
jgi:hypothetical protein